MLRRMKGIEQFCERPREAQQNVLRKLLRHGTDTEWGRRFGYSSIKSYEDFARAVPLSDYDALKDYIDRMRRGESNVLWPGRVKWFAKSSGTTNDKSKFIPVSPQGLMDTHYRGSKDSAVFYMKNNPGSHFADGKGLILGGSHQPNYNLPGSYVGDLSAILIENLPRVFKYMRVPSKETALLEDFEEKRNRIAQEAINSDVTNISGVPSWMLSVLHRVLEVSGKSTIAEVWPNLEVFFHGGVAFSPYREQYARIMGALDIRYEETYNASEGFFGVQSNPADPSLLLMLDYGVFYEFVPLEDIGKENPTVVPVWGVEAGKNYAILISTSCGLWRYQLGDTVKFTSTNPYKFIISGRTKSFINAFGEELIVDNAERGLAEVCASTGAVVKEYTAAPVFMDAEGRCRHQWVVEFAEKPADLNRFATELDTALQRINSDYEAKRHKNITLQKLEIVVARDGLFEDWLKSRGKLGGQHKVPRLSNNREVIEQVLALN